MNGTILNKDRLEVKLTDAFRKQIRNITLIVIKYLCLDIASVIYRPF